MSTTTEPTVDQITANIDTYLTALTESDPDARARQVDQAWTADGSFVDPLLAANGRDEIARLADTVLAQFPGHHFERTSGIDSHHSLVRFGWRLVTPEGDTAATGLDVAILDDSGKLDRVAGFFGELPPREDV